MSTLRQKLGGYKLVNITNFRDVSWMTQWEIENIGGVAYSYWGYQNKRGKTVRKVVKGHWNLSEGRVLDDKHLKELIDLMHPVFNETESYKEQSKQVEVLQKIIDIIKESKK